MGQFIVEISSEAKKELKQHKKAGNKVVNAKIVKILEELIEHPESGIGNPEQLKHQYSGLWSRRINSKDRLIYEIDAEIVTVYVISAMGHY